MKDHQIPQPAGGAELRVSWFSVPAHSALTDLVEATVGGEDGDAAVYEDGGSGAAVAPPAAGAHVHRSQRVPGVAARSTERRTLRRRGLGEERSLGGAWRERVELEARARPLGVLVGARSLEMSG